MFAELVDLVTATRLELRVIRLVFLAVAFATIDGGVGKLPEIILRAAFVRGGGGVGAGITGVRFTLLTFMLVLAACSHGLRPAQH